MENFEDLTELFRTKKQNEQFVKICAPMVRYSKLPFRLLVRKYGCDLAFTPMIMADAFATSQKARDNEFTTSPSDHPLVVQFAANKVEDFVAASQIVSPFCNGVDLNCGCPQRWACQEGLGACLIDRPEFLTDLLKQTRNRCQSKLSVSIKMRIHKELTRTVDLARQLEAAGATFISVHGRTKNQKSSKECPVNLDAIRLICESVNIPVVANGDVTSYNDAERTYEATGAAGIMVARGLLENPALFQGYQTTPKECIEDFVQIALETGTQFNCFHHHLVYMMEKSLSKPERKFFHTITSQVQVIDYLRENYDINVNL